MKTEQLAPPISQLDADKDPSAVVRAMDRLNADEILQTPESAKEFLNELNYEDFTRWLTFVNGLSRDIIKPERGFGGGAFVQTESFYGSSIEYMPPHVSQRDGLLRMAFEKAQRLDDPTTAGLTLGFAVNAIHPFPDGNGRTARLLYAILSKGYDGSQEASEYYSHLLENQTGREVINPNPASKGVEKVLANELREKVLKKRHYDATKDLVPEIFIGGYEEGVFADEETPDTLLVTDEISAIERQLLFNVVEDRVFVTTAVLMTFDKNRLAPYIRQSSDKKRTLIDGDAFVAQLTGEEIRKLASASYHLKDAYVKQLINFSNREDASEIVIAYTN